MKFLFPFKSNNKFSLASSLNSIIFFLLLVVFLVGCSSSKRFSDKKDYDAGIFNSINVLLAEESNELIISVEGSLNLSDGTKILAKIKSGNKLKFSNNTDELVLSIVNQEFNSDIFFLFPTDEAEIVEVNRKKYRGRLKFKIYNSQIKLINQINLEDYVKGVMIKEMPLGKGNENYEALKAFSICARTYAFNKIQENKDFFDIYPDTRDQVYGGVDGETEKTNKIVEETKGNLLFYENQPSIIFYHSTCGGNTEDVKNVFSKTSVPYLSGIEDGVGPYCKISPRYEWTEIYSQNTFIERLFNAGIIENKLYDITDAKVISRFESGRVNELEILLVDKTGEEKNVSIFGNVIRSIVRSADGNSILKSTFFEIDIKSENEIVISGKGSGHGVGLCQWGAIGQSKNGIDYRDILDHYFPGTKIKSIYD